MKKHVFFSAVRVVAFFVFTTIIPCSVTYADGTSSWHSMAQWQRNQLIINRAYQDINQSVGEECKEWVRDIIEDISSNYGHNPSVSIPPSNPPPNDWGWQIDYYGHILNSSIPIEYVQPGQIIQMRLTGGTPHTAIVPANWSGGVTFVDSNWYYQSAPMTVRVHSMTHQDFYNMLEVPWKFTVYQIL